MRASRAHANHVEEDEIVESSSSDTDDNGEMSDEEVATMHRVYLVVTARVKMRIVNLLEPIRIGTRRNV